MPLLFSSLCTFLSELESHSLRDPPFLPSDLERRYEKTITSWFNKHQQAIHAPDTNGVALLSALFPERRTDRVFWIKESTLARILKRCLRLGTERKVLLGEYDVPGRGDLGACVERVMRQTESTQVRKGGPLTINEVDDVFAVLHDERLGKNGTQSEIVLSNLYRGLQSHEAKWLTRLILKTLSPVVMPSHLVQRSFHFLLPDLLRVQDSFDAAVETLRSEPFKGYPRRPVGINETAYRLCAAAHLRPKINVKIARPVFQKARSLKHVGNMANNRYMNVQRKYDGYYCQIHIDLSRGQDCIQIFAKSGKDATKDRIGLHDAIRKGLRIGEADCKVRSKCIVEGEMLVYSDLEKRILDFHKIRKYVTGSGSFIGTENDSQPHEYEHLMIVFHDILLVDDNFVLSKPHHQRSSLLKAIVRRVDGFAELRERKVIDFSKPTAMMDLRRYFAEGIANRWEGIVLKPDDEAYFSFKQPSLGNLSAAWIKLKKDLIPGLGDTADFALIGASYDGKEASLLPVKNLRWTSFHVGCLMNKEQACRFRAKPIFREVDVLQPPTMNKMFMERLNRLGYFQEEHYDREKSNEYFDVNHDQRQLPKMSHLFKHPIVVELMGASFEKPSGVRYHALRFPRVQKIHEDRTFEEAVSFDELQKLADEARNAPKEELSQEELKWMLKLKALSRNSESQRTLSDGSYCTTERASETTPRSGNQKWSTSPAGPSIRYDYRTSPTLTRRPATPMVRMDSGEMRPGETRLTDGEVVVTNPVAALLTPSTASQHVENGTPTSRKQKMPTDTDPNMPIHPRKMARATLNKDSAIDSTSFTVATATIRGDATSQTNVSLSGQKNETRKRKCTSPSTDQEGSPAFVSPPPKRLRQDPTVQPTPEKVISASSQTRPTEKCGGKTAEEQTAHISNDSPTESDPNSLSLRTGPPQPVLRAEGSSLNPILVRDSEPPESQDTLPSLVSTDHEGEPLTFDQNGTPQLELKCVSFPLHRPRYPSLDLSHPEPVRTASDPAVSTENQVVGRRRRKSTDPGTRMIRETIKFLREPEAEFAAQKEVHKETSLDGMASASGNVAPPADEPAQPGRQRGSEHMPRTDDPAVLELPAVSPDRSGSQESLPPDIPAWYPLQWPTPLGFLSSLPDPTVLYTLSHISISTSALSASIRSEISSLLDDHFPTTHHTPHLSSFVTTPTVAFPGQASHLSPLAKFVLLDSQSPDIIDIFNKIGNKVLDVLRQWKQQGRLDSAGKIIFLDFRVILASARLTTHGVLEGIIRDGAMTGEQLHRFEPGPLEENREKRALLGEFWRENYFLGAAVWDDGQNGDARMVFEREECL